MRVIYEFLLSYWKEVLTACLFIVSFVLALARKKPNKVIDTIAEKVLSYIPILIAQAEDKFGRGTGAQKLEFVIDCLRGWFEINDLEFTAYYENIARDAIEKILATPQRKVN